MDAILVIPTIFFGLCLIIAKKIKIKKVETADILMLFMVSNGIWSSILLIFKTCIKLIQSFYPSISDLIFVDLLLKCKFPEDLYVAISCIMTIACYYKRIKDELTSAAIE